VVDFLTAGGALERRLRACLGGSLAVAAITTSWPGAAMAGPCRVVVADEEVRCPYHAIDSARHNVVFVDLADDAIRAADIGRPDSPSADLAFDPFLADLGWTAVATAVAPDLRRALVMRAKPSCPPYTGSPGPGIACSYGRVTLWLAYHDRSADEWVHVNLARRGLGRNSEAHGWSTWLHRDLALFNAIVFPDDGGFYTRQEENVTQIYAVRFRTDRDFAIEPFAPDLLWRADCLTGRVNAQPPRVQDRCFDGQRVSFVRRCYSEPLGPDTWAWWNTAAADGTGGPCIPGQPAMQVPVLRTYVMELDASCRPRRPFASMPPAHVPASGPVYRQIGVGPEWGDMLSAVSADGRYLAMATNMGDPQRPGDNCAGMKMNLRDATNPLSGEANRNTHVCELDSSLRCIDEPVRLGTILTPPEGTPLPGFVRLSSVNGFTRHVVFSRRWSQAGQPQINDVLRVDVDVGPDAGVPLQFGRNAVAILPVNHVPPAQRTGCSAAGAPDVPWPWAIVALWWRGLAPRRRRIHARPGPPASKLRREILAALVASTGALAACREAQPASDGGTRISSSAQMVFMSLVKPDLGPAGFEVVTMNLDGSNRRQLTDNARQEFLPHFSPDGAKLAYTIFTSGGYGQPGSTTDVGLDDLASNTEVNLTNTGEDSYPVWSPDGRRIAFLSRATYGVGLWIMNADGSGRRMILEPKGPPAELTFGDIVWSSEDWILFVVAQTTGDCFKTRLDKIRPDGTARTQVSDGGPDCTPPGKEQCGDADPGFSADGKTIYSSRGLPGAPAGGSPSMTERKLYGFSSDAWYSGKPETDLSLPSQPSCIEGVPKGSPDGKRILLFRACFDQPGSPAGIYLTDPAGSYRTFVAAGFGPDWNPAAR